nr:immunoglobulin heavy chain junction region [Mus musculus]NSM07664.1 immunoglobulin heavy chain junction region [Mus musculus]
CARGNYYGSSDTWFAYW